MPPFTSIEDIQAYYLAQGPKGAQAYIAAALRIGLSRHHGITISHDEEIMLLGEIYDGRIDPQDDDAGDQAAVFIEAWRRRPKFGCKRGRQ